MRDLGYVEGQDFVVEIRAPEGQYERYPELAAELVRQRCDVILATNSAAGRSLQQATTTIPIILVGINDPVGLGLVASLARPGGNVTGLSLSVDDTSPKQLELLAAILTNPSRVGYLGNAQNPAFPSALRIVQDAARSAGLTLIVKEAGDAAGIEAAFAAFGRERAQAVLIHSDGFLFGRRNQLVELALRYRLPSTYPAREFAADGGLMSYGESRHEFYRRAATFVHKIMRGAKPADLPVEQPTRFHLVINRKTADALGLTIPPILYIFAEEVIE
jgi:putative ABC transport system substrate-binding protein